MHNWDGQLTHHGGSTLIQINGRIGRQQNLIRWSSLFRTHQQYRNE